MKTKIANLNSKILGIIVLIVSFVGGWILMDIQSYANRPINSFEQAFLYTVKPGSSLKKISNELHQISIIEHPTYFEWIARWENLADRIQAGEFRFDPGITPLQILDVMVKGKVVQYSITIPEGWSFREMLAAVNQHDKIVHTLSGLSNEEIMKKLGYEGQHPEGFFYPETYYFPDGTKDSDLLIRAAEEMQKRLMKEWQERDVGLPLNNSYEALILASIIEKETAVPDERDEIAGVFIRRLEKGMRLQTDPTVIYGIGEKFDGNLRRRDLSSHTPYNTYMNKGLPPTPIALPGQASIHAALHPTPGDALYFVSRGDGTHHFSATIEEHNKAVRKYQLKMK